MRVRRYVKCDKRRRHCAGLATLSVRLQRGRSFAVAGGSSKTFLPLFVINLLPAGVAAIAFAWWAQTGELAKAAGP